MIKATAMTEMQMKKAGMLTGQTVHSLRVISFDANDNIVERIIEGKTQGFLVSDDEIQDDDKVIASKIDGEWFLTPTAASEGYKLTNADGDYA